MDGTYVLQLLANDSALQTTDTVTITVNPAAGSTTYQNGLNGYSGCQDSYISGGQQTTNLNGSVRVRVCGYLDLGIGNVERPIVKFDLSSIPTNTTIGSATLYVYSYDADAVRGSTGFYGAYHVNTNWSQSSVTWLSPWTTSGGDIDASPDAQAAKQAVAGVWYAFDVTSRAQSFIQNPSSNFGWIIRCTDENLHNQDVFTPSENADTVHRPKLVISGQQALPTVQFSTTSSSGGEATSPRQPDRHTQRLIQQHGHRRLQRHRRHRYAGK